MMSRVRIVVDSWEEDGGLIAGEVIVEGGHAH